MYKHKTHEKDKLLTILYFNLNETDLILTPGQIIAHGSMCSVQKSKSVINVVKPSTPNPAVMQRLWTELKLDENEILNKNPKSKNCFIQCWMHTRTFLPQTNVLLEKRHGIHLKLIWFRMPDLSINRYDPYLPP